MPPLPFSALTTAEQTFALSAVVASPALTMQANSCYLVAVVEVGLMGGLLFVNVLVRLPNDLTKDPHGLLTLFVKFLVLLFNFSNRSPLDFFLRIHRQKHVHQLKWQEWEKFWLEWPLFYLWR